MKLKQAVLLVVMGLLPLGVIAQSSNLQFSVPPPTAAPPAMPEKGKLSYAIGMYFGNNITNSVKRGELEVDTNAVIKAITDVLNARPTELTQKEMSDVLGQLRTAMQARQKAKDEEAKGKSQAFLDKFAKSPGAITLSNGLEYKVITAGTGPMPQENDTVTVAYRGTLIDGTEFDHNDNFKTPLKGRIIQGWQKILPMMNVGSKWEVVIPSSLGYGPRGHPPTIPANSALVFDMELKSTAAGPAMPPPGANSSVGTSRALNPSSTTPVVSGQIIKVPSADELKKGAKIEVINSGQTNAASPQ